MSRWAAPDPFKHRVETRFAQTRQAARPTPGARRALQGGNAPARQSGAGLDNRVIAQEHGKAGAGLGRHMQAFRGRQVVAGIAADLADDGRAGLQPFLQGPERVRWILGFDQKHMIGWQAPLFEGQRVGAPEILGASTGRPDPEDGTSDIAGTEALGEQADLESQGCRRIEIAAGTDLVQAWRDGEGVCP